MKPLSSVFSAGVAVDSFFVISGFLIFMSYERSNSLKDYFAKRFRRIYPAYLTVIVICAILGLFFSSHSSLHQYYSIDWLKYFLSNLSFMNFLQPTLPGVFEENHMPLVNGSLWTIKAEVMFYLAVPLIFFFLSRYNRLLVIGLICGGSILFCYPRVHGKEHWQWLLSIT